VVSLNWAYKVTRPMATGQMRMKSLTAKALGMSYSVKCHHWY